MNPLYFRRAWIAAGIAGLLLVVYLSLAPDSVDAGRMGQVKVGHFIAYGWLMLWFSQLHEGWRPRLLAALAFVLLGIALEYGQLVTGYRTFAYADMRDNALGVLTGAVLAFTPLGNTLGRVDNYLAVRRARLAPSGRSAS